MSDWLALAQQKGEVILAFDSNSRFEDGILYPDAGLIDSVSGVINKGSVISPYERDKSYRKASFLEFKGKCLFNKPLTPVGNFTFICLAWRNGWPGIGSDRDILTPNTTSEAILGNYSTDYNGWYSHNRSYSNQTNARGIISWGIYSYASTEGKLHTWNDEYHYQTGISPEDMVSFSTSSSRGRLGFDTKTFTGIGREANKRVPIIALCLMRTPLKSPDVKEILAAMESDLMPAVAPRAVRELTSPVKKHPYRPVSGLYSVLPYERVDIKHTKGSLQGVQVLHMPWKEVSPPLSGGLRVKDIVTKEDVPTRTKLFLYERYSGDLLFDTWSNDSGEFSFPYVPAGEYRVDSYDPEAQFRSITKDYTNIK